MEAVNNTRIYYEELYFVKMLVLMYFLYLGKKSGACLVVYISTTSGRFDKVSLSHFQSQQNVEKIRYRTFLSYVVRVLVSVNVIKFGKITVERRW